MNQPTPSEENLNSSGINQKGENSTLGGGMQAIQGDNNIQQQNNINLTVPSPPPPPTGIPHNLPYSGAEKFVGRGDKLELLDQELTNCQQVVIAALAGMGGIGKTELALQYALRYQDSYPGGLCWLQVRGKELGIQIIDFARKRININPPDDFDLEGQVEYCWSHWKEGRARYSEAQPLYEQALEIRKGLFEGDHPDVALSLNNLAFLYDRQGRYSEAEPLYEQALEMLEQTLGTEHPNTITARNNLESLREEPDRK